jgi:hypothetical protein
VGRSENQLLPLSIHKLHREVGQPELLPHLLKKVLVVALDPLPEKGVGDLDDQALPLGPHELEGLEPGRVAVRRNPALNAFQDFLPEA